MPAPPKDESRDSEAFLSRWSRRKQIGPETAIVEPLPETVPDDAPVDEELTDEELLAELDLPDPDTMKDDADFSAFMKARVPERLRRRALRTLWRSNPVLANLDELVDYGEDYTDAATVMENMQTVYEVGKGAAEKWKRHVAALAAAEEEEAAARAAEPASVVEEARKPDVVQEIAPVETRSVEPIEVSALPIRTAEILPLPARHMRFRFD